MDKVDFVGLIFAPKNKKIEKYKIKLIELGVSLYLYQKKRIGFPRKHDSRTTN
jgi:hypothetical protein